MRILLSFLPFLLSTSLLSGQIPDYIFLKHTRYSLEEFREFLSLPNVAPDSAQMESNIKWLETAFSLRGFRTRRLPTQGLDLLLADREVEGAEKTVLFYVQVDGQPVDASQWEQEDPFQPVLKVGSDSTGWQIISWDSFNSNFNTEWRIFGRSASDAKGPILMFLAAVDILREAGIQVPYNIKVIMDTEEELGSPHLPEAVKEWRETLSSDYLVILDGPMHPSLRPTLVFGARGIATIALTSFGPRVPQHSGHYGNYAPNPALQLSQLLASMKDDRGRVVIPDFYEGVSLSEEVKQDLAQVPDSEAEIRKLLGIAEPDSVAGTLQEAIQYPSLNIRGLRSGWVGEEVRTIVPAQAIAEIDVRLVRENDPERLIELIRRHIKDQGYHFIEGEKPTEEERLEHSKLISMESSISYPAFRTELDHPLGEWLAEALKKTWGQDPIRIRTHGGSIPIAPFVHTLQVPAVAVPLVNPDNNQHSPNENIRLGSYFAGVESCVGILSTPIK